MTKLQYYRFLIRFFADTKKVEAIQPIKAFECLTGLNKTIKINLSYGSSKDKLLGKVSAFEAVRFVSERE